MSGAVWCFLIFLMMTLIVIGLGLYSFVVDYENFGLIIVGFGVITAGLCIFALVKAVSFIPGLL